MKTLDKSFVAPAKDYGRSKINYKELEQFYIDLLSLPTKRPFIKLLLTANDILRRPPLLLSDSMNIRWLLILFEIPTLADCLYHERKGLKVRSDFDTPEVKSLSYEIIKRIIGYLAHLENKPMEQLARWFSAFSTQRFAAKVQLINLYVTFHLTRLINLSLSQKQRSSTRLVNSVRACDSNSPDYSEYSGSVKLNSSLSDNDIIRSPTLASPSHRLPFQLPRAIQSGFTNWNDWTSAGSASDKELKTSDFKLKVFNYGKEWHIQAAARLQSVFFAARKRRLPEFAFYNTLVDYISLKQDFEVWQSTNRRVEQDDSTSFLYDIIQSGGVFPHGLSSGGHQFTFCQYPFLLSLGAKISILEYEARRSMERKAEEAFIKAIGNRRFLDVNLRIQVRRGHIANDSMRCIKSHQGDLKKALKIEFIGEPGIDAGGLKKEWFHLLTKELFNQENGMFYYNDESHLCWFAPMPLERNDELFYMVGVVLGLAIYNSTILDLKFPLVLYKKLLGKKATLDDYIELFPTTGKGLSNLLDYKGDMRDLNLYFDTTFRDSLGELVIKELVPNGSKLEVTKENCRLFIHHWIDFYLNTVIGPQFDSFYKGFHTVIGGNALSLFAPKEVEMIICGDKETKIDAESLKGVTKYCGWSSEEAARNSEVIKWFWEWVDELTYEEQRKFLSFVTGSDRIPATGISTMNFKITRLQTVAKVKKLPVAHTCFNELCLNDYDTKEEMVKKLNLSINESEGFGLR